MEYSKNKAEDKDSSDKINSAFDKIIEKQKSELAIANEPVAENEQNCIYCTGGKYCPHHSNEQSVEEAEIGQADEVSENRKCLACNDTEFVEVDTMGNKQRCTSCYETEYNGYIITPNLTGYVNFDFYEKDSEIISGNGKSIEDCKTQIDEIIYANSEEEITIGQAVIKFMETQSGTVGAANAFREGANWQQSKIQRLQSEKAELVECLANQLNLLEYISEHNDGVGICLGYQSDEMITKHISEIKYLLKQQSK